MTNEGPTAKDGSKQISKMTFEEALSALERVVEDLDRGMAPLDEAIEMYVYGTQLRKHCSEKLETAQERVAKIQETTRDEESTSY